MTTDRFIAYYRVSNTHQLKPGVKAQREIVRNFLKPDQKIEKEFTEVGSGDPAALPVLQQALEYTKQVQGTLVLARIDRADRIKPISFALRDSGVKVISPDLPDDNSPADIRLHS